MRVFIVLIIALLLAFLIATKLKNKGLAIFLITYIVATLIRAFTVISFNPFYDEFELIPFIKDLAVWTLSYVGVSLVISRLYKPNKA